MSIKAFQSVSFLLEEIILKLLGEAVIALNGNLSGVCSEWVEPIILIDAAIVNWPGPTENAIL